LRALVLLLALLCASAPTQAASSLKTRGTVATLTVKTKRFLTKKLIAARMTLAIPARRKQLIGKTSMAIGGIIAGVALDGALLMVGLPPLSATLLASGVPTLGQHFLQQKLHLHAPSYFEPEKDKTPGQLARDIVVAGAVGYFGGIGVDKVTSALGSLAPNAKLSLLVSDNRPLMAALSKRAMSFATWTWKQFANQKASDAVDAWRENNGLADRLSSFTHASADESVGVAQD
jgi:hypothetical protein